MEDASTSQAGPSFKRRGRPRKKSRPKKTPAKPEHLTAEEAALKKKYKAPRSVSIPVTSETLSYGESFFTRGDVVSMVCDGLVYYAQIRGLLQDQYHEKSAVITWLIPTDVSPETGFDPNTFIIGPEEEFPRNLADMEFVCHSPNEYFKCTNPYLDKIPQKPTLGFAKTRKGYVIVPLPAVEFSTDSE